MRNSAKGTCTYPGCTDPVLALLLCCKHYKRLKRHGDPSIVLPPNTSEKSRTLHLTTAVDPPVVICAQPVNRAYLAISLERPGDAAIVLTRSEKPLPSG